MLKDRQNHSGERIYAYYIVYAFGFIVFTTGDKY